MGNKADCSGCHACMSACPKSCISMKKDKEGFLYPQIDKKNCIGCNKCKRVCQSITPLFSEESPEAYACYNTDKEVRMQSSSGGIFSLIAERIIDSGGVVFGASFVGNLNVKHICIDNKKDLSLLRGSKYIQSTIGDTFIQVKKILDEGRLVLFTGTPCQIDGLLHYLNKTYENLFTQDFICHGVPSPNIWQQYIKYIERNFKSKIDLKEFPKFRDKKKGWEQFSVSMRFENGHKYIETLEHDKYMVAFLNNLCLRPSCYNCKSKGLSRRSDITLADFWGIKNIMPGFFDDKGVSFIMLNSEAGRKMFQALHDRMIYKRVDVNEAIKYNSSAIRSVGMPSKRKRFMRNRSINKFTKMDSYLKDSIYFLLKCKVGRLYYKFKK